MWHCKRATAQRHVAQADSSLPGVRSEPGTGLDPVITGNVIRGTKLGGIEVMPGAKPVIEGNTISNGETGIRLVKSDTMVRTNVVTGQTVGVTIFGGAPTIEGNTLDSNETAIREARGSTATIGGNFLYGNETDRTVDNVTTPLPAGNTACAVAASTAP